MHEKIKEDQKPGPVTDLTSILFTFGLKFEDLYGLGGLKRIDKLFIDDLRSADPDLVIELADARENASNMNRKEQADLILKLAPYVDNFICQLFRIDQPLASLREREKSLENLYTCKRLFVQRQAAKPALEAEADNFNGEELRAKLQSHIGKPFDQIAYSNSVVGWMDDKESHEEALDTALKYAAWALFTDVGRAYHESDVLFRKPSKKDHFNLVPTETVTVSGTPMLQYPCQSKLYPRDAFHLTDSGTDEIGALDEANYCIICHERGRDYCSIGNPEKKTGEFTIDPLGVELAGCPLEERISEMHKARLDGNVIASLATIVIDNPMAAGTGHRICNDCMLACIYQKQDPVNIPQAETQTLKEVLNLPWGFEIYSLLTRWNPLNFARPLPLADSGYKVLIVGLGPAGYTLAHYLMNEGHHVVAVDGLKIEPLDPEISGIDGQGNRVPFKPIRDWSELWEDLDERVLAGFGGVAEYGITVRWDKNFLLLLRLLLERRAAFNMFGGIRFGSEITAESAFDMGFDHIALCLGAGKPTTLTIPNGLANGVRQASDFLMALQLTGAAKEDALANLQIRLPVVVIGGGLTGIDTATEALAYYVRQVEKFTARYDILTAELGEADVRAAWSEDEAAIADEFIAHGRAIRSERDAAKAESRAPRFIDLLNEWGGATLVYRRRLIDSPSYRLNHEEVTKALEQGIRFAELLAPTTIDVDENKRVKSITFNRQQLSEDGKLLSTDEEVTLPAHAVLIAAGTQPNTVLAREYKGFAEIDGKYFQAFDEDGHKVKPQWTTKPDNAYVLMRHESDGRCMSFFGDLHPSYAGNVVKAMASAKQGYPVLDRMLRRCETSEISAQDLAARLNTSLRAKVVEIIRLTPTVLEVIVHAPLAAQRFRPGQFFRLQNFEKYAGRVENTVLGMEGLAMTGAWVDREKGLVSVIVLEMGGSSDLCQFLRKGEPVVLMGPTGAPTEIAGGETVLLVGGGLGNAVLFSIGRAFREAGSRVLYFAGYKKPGDRYHIGDVEAASDMVVWCCDEEPGFEPGRPGDRTIVANIVEAMYAYAKGDLGPIDIPLSDVDRIIAIGSDGMMSAVKEARHSILKSYLKPDHVAIGSINSPMQCMMKEICGQCLQRHVDPVTGERSIVYSCFNQDQPLDKVSFAGLHERLCQNAVQEKLTRKWIERCVGKLKEKEGSGENAQAVEITH